MADFHAKFRVLAGLTNQFAGFKSAEVSEMRVPEAEAAGFAAEKRISQEQQKAIKLVASAVGDTRPSGDYWRMSARVSIGEGAVYAGMAVGYMPKPNVLVVGWSASPAWKDEKNEQAVSQMVHALSDFEPVLRKYGSVERDFQVERQFVSLHLNLPVGMADQYVADLDKLASRFGKLVAKYADMASSVDMESIEVSVVALVKDLEEGRMLLPGTTRRRKDGMYKLSSDGRWLKVKKKGKKPGGSINDIMRARTAKPRRSTPSYPSMGHKGPLRIRYDEKNDKKGPIASRMALLLSRPVPPPVEEAMAGGEIVRLLQTLKAGDKVELQYQDGSQVLKSTREVSQSWDDLKAQAKSDAWKRPAVMLKAKAKGKFKEGIIRDYGDDRVMWQPTMATQVTDVVDLKKV